MARFLEFGEITCPIESAYLAGIIDSLACYTLKVDSYKGYDKWFCSLVINTRNPELIAFLNTRFKSCRDRDHGGNGSHTKWTCVPDGKLRKWVATGELLRHLLSITIDKLILQKDLARLLLKWLETGSYWGTKVPENIREERMSIKEEFDKIKAGIKRPHRNKQKKAV